MTQQQTDPVQQSLAYMRHQGAKAFPEIDAMLERTVDDWRRCLEGMTDVQASFKPAGEWCAKEALGHSIISNCSINQDVAELGGIESPAEKAAEVRAMGMQSPQHEAMAINDLCDMMVGALEETRMLAIALQKSESLEKSFPHPLFGSLNLKEWLAFQRIHSLDHIQQIDKIKAEPAYPKS
jgi:hypothetical protein